MSARIIDGKGMAGALRARVAAEVARLATEHGVTPGIAFVQVGADPASQVYVRSKGKAVRESGWLDPALYLDGSLFLHRLA